MLLLEALVVIFFVTVVATYVMAACEGHVPWVFPYISDTGATEPESCVFSLGMNLSASLFLVAVYLRYREVLEFRARSFSPGISVRANRVALGLGVSCALGLCFVANFQVDTLLVPHYFGACLCFVGGTVYFVMQAVFSRTMHPHVGSLRAVFLRLGLSFVSGLAFLICFIAALVAYSEFDGTDEDDWLPSNKGYSWHLVSTGCEWLGAFLFASSIVTYIPEARAAVLHPPKFRVVALESVSEMANWDKYSMFFV